LPYTHAVPVPALITTNAFSLISYKSLAPKPIALISFTLNIGILSNTSLKLLDLPPVIAISFILSA